jgi:hypothetical protein
MVSWQNVELKIVSLQNGKLTKWWVDKVVSWQIGELPNWWDEK